MSILTYYIIHLSISFLFNPLLINMRKELNARHGEEEREQSSKGEEVVVIFYNENNLIPAKYSIFVDF